MSGVLKMMRATKPPPEFPKQNKANPEDLYELDKELGSGAYSVVYLGVEKATNKSYAVKVVDKKNTSARSMLSEIEVMAKLEDSHLVGFKEIFDTAKGYYVVLEYITGGELFDRIIDLHHYTEKDASRVIRETMLGIAHMHDKMLVHRDLKPENLLLSTKDADAAIKVADFGFAKPTEDDKDLTALVGTPPYMAPELVRLRHYDAEGGYGRSVDIWAIGVILYILLSGIHPFQIDDEEEMLENIEHTRWNWLGDNWENVSESAKDLIRKLLEPNPAKRPDIHAALKHPWVVGETASGTDLAGAKDELKKFQARKKFKAAFKAVAATNRLKLAALSLKKSRDDAAQQHEEPVENNFIPYEELIGSKTLPEGVDPNKKEDALSTAEFLKIFGMSKEDFAKLPDWKKTNMKKERKLF